MNHCPHVVLQIVLVVATGCNATLCRKSEVAKEVPPVGYVSVSGPFSAVSEIPIPPEGIKLFRATEMAIRPGALEAFDAAAYARVAVVLSRGRVNHIFPLASVRQDLPGDIGLVPGDRLTFLVDFVTELFPDPTPQQLKEGFRYSVSGPLAEKPGIIQTAAPLMLRDFRERVVDPQGMRVVSRVQGGILNRVYIPAAERFVGKFKVEIVRFQAIKPQPGDTIELTDPVLDPLILSGVVLKSVKPRLERERERVLVRCSQSDNAVIRAVHDGCEAMSRMGGRVAGFASSNDRATQ